MVKSCDFGLSEDKLIRTQIVLGINNKDLQARLLREDLELEKVVQHCQISEQADINTKLLESEGGSRVDSMENRRQFKSEHVKRATAATRYK